MMTQNEERELMDDTLFQIIQANGAEKVLWGFVKTLSTDKYDEFLADLCWSLGEDYESKE